MPNKISLEVLYYTSYNHFNYFKVTMNVNQEITSKFQQFSDSLNLASNCEIQKIKQKLALDLAGYKNNEFSLIFMGSLARREASKTYDRDSILIFANHVEQARREEIAEKCISSFEDLGIPICSGGMSIDSKQAVKSLHEWREFFECARKTPNAKRIIFIEAMRSSILLFGSPDLYEEHQSLVKECVLAGLTTDFLLVESFLNLFLFSKSKTKLVLNQIIKFNYIYEPKLFFESSFTKGMNFLCEKRILKVKDIHWLKGFYVDYMSDRSLVAADCSRSKRDINLAQSLNLRLIAGKVLVRATLKRILGRD
tara:strand:- start:33919 stop:34848 length:930 start_codon:yes stop_codon:yes gene_type:complete